MPRVVLCTLVLNEMEHLPRLYAQHRDWPGLAAWVFVESADRTYVEANRRRGQVVATGEGLSVDGTSEWLRDLRDDRVVYVRYGFCGGETNAANGKCEARQRYLDVAESFAPDYLIILDADEFYTHAHQAESLRLMDANPTHTAYCFRYRHPWRPPGFAGEPLFKREVVGGFWSIQHCHAWRWERGLRYESFHMTPQRPDGTMLSGRMVRFSQLPGSGDPQCIHMAFSSDLESRQRKHWYYVARGESAEPRRAYYVQSRAAWEKWEPGKVLPRGAKVVDYDGPVPEVFAGE